MILGELSAPSAQFWSCVLMKGELYSHLIIPKGIVWNSLSDNFALLNV